MTSHLDVLKEMLVWTDQRLIEAASREGAGAAPLERALRELAALRAAIRLIEGDRAAGDAQARADWSGYHEVQSEYLDARAAFWGDVSESVKYEVAKQAREETT